VTVVREVIAMDDVSLIWNNVENFFSDKLPAAEWFDLSSSIAKYDSSERVPRNSSRGKQVWNWFVFVGAPDSSCAALEDIHVKLGGYYERVVALCSRYTMIQEPVRTGTDGLGHFDSCNRQQDVTEQHKYTFALRSAFEKL
jgi:hypothetical protein